jgi:hypothetical protein
LARIFRKTQPIEHLIDLETENPQKSKPRGDTFFTNQLEHFIVKTADFLEDSVNLKIQNFESNFLDPFIQKISLQFDECGYKGLLTNSLIYDASLVYILINEKSSMNKVINDQRSRASLAALFKNQPNIFLRIIKDVAESQICSELASFRENFRDVY